MESYVIRVYRRDDTNSRDIIGILEDVEINRKITFSNIEELFGELWNVLNREGISHEDDVRNSFDLGKIGGF
ncbi:MAG: hypothetical protein AB1610_01680 [Nitrospirota bacterium]